METRYVQRPTAFGHKGTTANAWHDQPGRGGWVRRRTLRRVRWRAVAVTGFEASSSAPALPRWFGPRASPDDPAVSALIASGTPCPGTGPSSISGGWPKRRRGTFEPCSPAATHRMHECDDRGHRGAGLYQIHEHSSDIQRPTMHHAHPEGAPDQAPVQRRPRATKQLTAVLTRTPMNSHAAKRMAEVNEGMEAVQAMLVEDGVSTIQAIAVTRALLGWAETPLRVAIDTVTTSSASNEQQAEPFRRLPTRTDHAGTGAGGWVTHSQSIHEDRTQAPGHTLPSARDRSRGTRI